MKIDPYSPLQAAARAKQAKKSSGVSGDGLFAGMLGGMDEAEETIAAEQPKAAAPLSSLDMMLALQEVPDDEFERKRAVRQANATLDSLEELRMSILMGNVSGVQLERISARISAQQSQTQDPKLKAILNEIEIRAAVELAKMGRY
jgi:hypothetical protein